MSFLRRTVATSATAVLLATGLFPGLPTSAASAAPAPPPALPWRFASCVQAGVSGVQPDTKLDYFVVTGSATECAAPTLTDRPVGFGLVTYRGRAGLPGVLYGHNVRVFPPPEGWKPTPIPFGALAIAKSVEAHGVGVCVIGGPTTLDPKNPVYYYANRVTCIRVTVTASDTEGFVATMEPLATNDPLVSGPISQRSAYTGHTSPPGPVPGGGGNPAETCGTCF